MKCKIHPDIECSYPLISLLTAEGLNTINYICHTHYTKEEVKAQITIKRKEESHGFWERLMRTKPGFDRGDNDIH